MRCRKGWNRHTSETTCRKSDEVGSVWIPTPLEHSPLSVECTSDLHGYFPPNPHLLTIPCLTSLIYLPLRTRLSSFTYRDGKMTADMSPESPSTAVKRRYRDSMLPARHLSCPSANIPYFPPSLQEKVRVTSNAVSQPDRFRKRMFSIPHTINLDESGQLDYKIMSWKDQHSDRPVPPIPCKAYDRCAPKLLRSTSVADLYSQPSYMEYCSTSQVSHLPSSAWNFRGAATNEASIQEEQDVSPTSSPQASSAAPPHARRPTLPHSVSETVVTEKKLRRRTRYKSYHDLHILSMYQDNASVSSLNSTHSSSFKSDVDEDEPVEELTHSDTSSQESLPLPETPSDLEVTCEPSAIGRAITKSASPNHSHARHASVIDYNHEKRYSLDEDIGEFMPVRLPPKLGLLHKANVSTDASHNAHRSRPSETHPNPPPSAFTHCSKTSYLTPRST